MSNIRMTLDDSLDRMHQRVHPLFIAGRFSRDKKWTISTISILFDFISFDIIFFSPIEAKFEHIGKFLNTNGPMQHPEFEPAPIVS